MKFSMNDFIELDLNGLLEINGGGSCSSISSRGSSGGGSCSSSHSGGYGSSSSGSCSSSYGRSNGSGSCSSYNITKNSRNENSPGISFAATGSGNCNSTCGSENPVQNPTNISGNGESNPISYQTPDNPNDYHCDINSFNVAVDQGIKNPGTWDGNSLTVNEIYTQYYGNGNDSPEAGTKGYGFYSNDGGKTYSHMFFYQYNGGDTYHVWNSDGISPATETNWNINGKSANNSVFVPLN